LFPVANLSSTEVEKHDKVLKPYSLNLTLVAILDHPPLKPYYLIGFQAFYAMYNIELRLLSNQ